MKVPWSSRRSLVTRLLFPSKAKAGPAKESAAGSISSRRSSPAMARSRGSQRFSSITVRGAVPPSTRFRRGHVNPDDRVDIADAIWILQFLFYQGPPVACQDASDLNDDGLLDIADALWILQYAFFDAQSRTSRSRLAVLTSPTTL